MVTAVPKTTYPIVPFVSGKTQPDSSYERIAKAVWKGRGVEPRPSLCASIPKLTGFEQAELSVLMPYFINLVETVQDRLVKELAETGATEVSEEAVSIQAVASYLEDQQKGARLNKEEVQAWFDTNLAEILSGAVLKKLSGGKKATVAQQAQAAEILEEYKDRLAGLAGGRTEYAPEICEMLLKAVDLMDTEEDAIADKLHRRLDSMIAKSQKPTKLIGI